MSVGTVVIVGGGQAACQAAVSLRQEGYAGRIVMIGDEAVLPYQRPPLSKAYLAGQLAVERLFLRPPAFYEQQKIEVQLGRTASRIDVIGRQVELDNGERIDFDQLVLATGGRPRKLACPGAEHSRLFYLRDVRDVAAIQAQLKPGARIALVGGGYIGLEIAAVARKLGLDVTVLEAAPSLLARVTCPQVANFYQREHEAHGVKIRCGVMVNGIAGDESHPAVLTADGQRIEADFIVAGIGLLPNVELAMAAGLVCDNGIIVDDECRTSVPGVYAAGDCAQHPSAVYHTRLRLESVPNAIEQGKTTAAAICGKSKPYRQVPWFWSDQYDIKLQTAGLNRGYDEVVIRGAPESRSFAAWYLRDGRLLAVDAINRPAEFTLAKSWIAEGLHIPSERLSDETIAVKSLAAAA
ncbi:NAD(P)/FAD-dependent oxidoreductase [Nevskia sp.]|uniref:NAD(P)/FAD-dependent oxidoreductase n=1 Tax=Nevskia sp. TaxID=1929292 RepID=UPI003F725871